MSQKLDCFKTERLWRKNTCKNTSIHFYIKSINVAVIFGIHPHQPLISLFYPASSIYLDLIRNKIMLSDVNKPSVTSFPHFHFLELSITKVAIYRDALYVFTKNNIEVLWVSSIHYLLDDTHHNYAIYFIRDHNNPAL